MLEYFHLHIGPVQEWIGQGRRTQDLWAGSFILSWLSGQAIAALLEQGVAKADILSPFLDDGTMPDAFVRACALSGKGLKDETREEFARSLEQGELPLPFAGCIPNQISARILSGEFKPADVEKRVRQKWQELAQAVGTLFSLDGTLSSEGCLAGEEVLFAHARSIWRHQTGLGDGGSGQDPFWRIYWVMSCEAAPVDLFARRQWRNQMPAGEWLGRADGLTADYCSQIPGLNELSGFRRLAEPDEQSEFWADLQGRLDHHLRPNNKGQEKLECLELREDERLSAVALVKRCLPYLEDDVLRSVLGWVPLPSHASAQDKQASILGSGKGLSGSAKKLRRYMRYWPSTAYMASAGWLSEAGRRLVLASRTERVDAPGEFLKGLNTGENGYHLPQAYSVAEETSENKIRSLREAGSVRGSEEQIAEFKELLLLDGGAFHERSLLAGRLVPVRRDEPDPVKKKRGIGKEQAKALKAFRNEIDKVTSSSGKLEAPGPFYAMLVMDGDEMGKLSSSAAVRRGTSRFIGSVGALIDKHNGILVYAGGDDVFALLPLEDAIPAAIAVRNEFCSIVRKSLDQPDEDRTELQVHLKPVSISAGLVFADYQMHFADVRSEAKGLLEKHAKQANGKDSLAVSILKSGGLQARWTVPWVGADGVSPAEKLIDLVKRQTTKAIFPNRFFYVLSQRYGALLDTKRSGVGGAGITWQDSEFLSFFKQAFQAEYVALRQFRNEDAKTAALRDVEALFRICRFEASKTHSAGRAANAKKENVTLQLDAIYLFKFLAENWRRAEAE